MLLVGVKSKKPQVFKNIKNIASFFLDNSKEEWPLKKPSMDFAAHSFRSWGYLQANLDYLGRLEKTPHRDLDSVPEEQAKKWREIYCGTFGVEFMHMPLPERCDWIINKLESQTPLKQLEKEYILERLISAQTFEQFLHKRYIGSIRFSLEGLDPLIPLLDSVLDEAANNGCEIAMIGMAHRGRLNTMYHIAGVGLENVFGGFEDVDHKSVLGSGDVKYHKGATGVYRTASGKEIGIHLASNPSHLEAVGPVIMGRVKARQKRLKDKDCNKVVGILIHGDAAFAGQGITAECLNFSGLYGFDVGGVIHIIANNLIGFTAEPHALHSGKFCTDVAKRINAPIIHVNAADPDAVSRVGYLATEYKHVFSSDVVIDLLGYRKHGHNEGDDPTVTSPILYKDVKDADPIPLAYAKEIGVNEEKIKSLEKSLVKKLNLGHKQGQQMQTQPVYYHLPNYWSDYYGGFYQPSFEVEHGSSKERIQEVAQSICKGPENFAIHPKQKALLKQRQDMADGKRAVDWGTAEALAFGTLLLEGTPIRFVGQDSRRGTFNQRHSVLIDIENGNEHYPLGNLSENQERFKIYDSMLSEAAAVGFEYGYSRDYPEALVLWEAQFGDFVNGAQIIIDQFISSGEDKWSLLSGLVMLLPHGYEGRGPEHSSAKIERFLQIAGEDNMQIAYPSTSKQYFHLIRRQGIQKWKKPLVVFTPKSMLRAAPACVNIEDFADGRFERVLGDTVENYSAKRILISSGKITHELRKERDKREDIETAIITLEQFYPFPEKELKDEIAKYKDASIVCWVQEEPANMGALSFIRPLLKRVANGKKISSVKRSTSASPATGSAKAHALEQEAIINLAFARY